MGYSHYKHIIWDWNGTILDDVALVMDSLSEMLKREGKEPVSLTYYQTHFRFPVREFYEQLGLCKPGEDFHRHDDAFHELYDSRVLTNATVHTELVEVFDVVNKRGATNHILSARNHTLLNQEVQHFGLRKHFSHICGTKVGPSAIGKLAAARELFDDLDAHKGEMLLIGDTLHDYEAARHLDIDCLLIAHGHNNRERLGRSGTTIVENTKELLHALTS